MEMEESGDHMPSGSTQSQQQREANQEAILSEKQPQASCSTTSGSSSHFLSGINFDSGNDTMSVTIQKIAQKLTSFAKDVNAPVTKEEIDNCDDVKTLRQRCHQLFQSREMLEIQLQLMQLQRTMDLEAHLKQQDEIRTRTDVTRREDWYKQILHILETEFNCSICNEVYIQPTVVGCGHTFCNHCISEWRKEKHDCPICRKRMPGELSKHVEMENFLSKFNLFLSQEIREKREQIIRERREQSLREQRQQPTEVQRERIALERREATLQALGLHMPPPHQHQHQHQHPPIGTPLQPRYAVRAASQSQAELLLRERNRLEQIAYNAGAGSGGSGNVTVRIGGRGAGDDAANAAAPATPLRAYQELMEERQNRLSNQYRRYLAEPLRYTSNIVPVMPLSTSAAAAAQVPAPSAPPTRQDLEMRARWRNTENMLRRRHYQRMSAERLAGEGGSHGVGCRRLPLLEERFIRRLRARNAYPGSLADYGAALDEPQNLERDTSARSSPQALQLNSTANMLETSDNASNVDRAIARILRRQAAEQSGSSSGSVPSSVATSANPSEPTVTISTSGPVPVSGRSLYSGATSSMTPFIYEQQPSASQQPTQQGSNEAENMFRSAMEFERRPRWSLTLPQTVPLPTQGPPPSNAELSRALGDNVSDELGSQNQPDELPDLPPQNDDSDVSSMEDDDDPLSLNLM